MMRTILHPLTALLLALALRPLTAQTAPACTGLCLQQVACPTGSSTTITGTVYAPNGVDPVPNVTVYVPNAPVSTLPAGISCPVPGQLPSGSPLIGTFTAVDGGYTLADAPVGTNIPVVITAGKWRRQVVLPGTVACGNTHFDIRFPRTQAEGDIPKFAVSTGDADQVECVLREVGIDDAEFTDPAGNGRVQLYTSTLKPGARADAATPTADSLMGDTGTLNSYDVLMLPCEGAAHTEPADQLGNLVSYANAGGRVYGSHFAYEWFWHNPPFNAVANWTGSTIGPNFATATVNQGFSTGANLAQWLQLVKASTTLGQIDLEAIKFDISGVNPPTQVWLNLNSTGNPVMQFTFDTPVGATSGQCGRVLFNEYHVENNDLSGGKIFPAECSTAAMTPQEKLLEYSLFDLSNNGSAATIAPGSVDFGDEVIGFQSAPKTFTVKNNSVFSGVLTSASATGDFLVSGNTCGTSVRSGDSCTVSVAFKPSTLGAHTGQLNLVFGGTTLTAALSGNGVPALAIQSTSLDFGSTDVTTTVPRTLVLTNNAPSALSLPTINASGDYTATSSCPSTLPVAGTCAINIAFTPTVYGSRPGTLTVTGSATTLTAALTGTGLDFSTAMNPSSGTVVAGLSATTAAVATPLGGFNAPITLSCAINAPGATCTLQDTTVPLSSVTSVNVTVSTTSQYTVIGYGAHSNWILGLVEGLGAALLLAVRRRSRGLLASVLVLLVMAGVTALSGCSGKLPSMNAVYTPPGSYTVQISATDGTLTRTASYALTVKTR